MADDSYNLWRYASSTWAELLSGDGIGAVVYDPNNCSASATCHIFGVSAGAGGANIWFSLNGGGSFTGAVQFNYPLTANDVPWLAATNEQYLVILGAKMDPTSALMWAGTGIGVFTATPPVTNAAYTYTSVSAAIEQLVSYWGISPPSGNPVFTFEDRPIFVSTSLTAYPTQHGTNYNGPLQNGYSADYCKSSPSTVVFLGGDSTAYTASIGNGGPTNWTAFSSYPQSMIPNGTNTGPVAFDGGTIACSTPNDIMLCTANDGNCSYTTNGGTSWGILQPAGVPLVWGATPSTNTTSGDVLHFSAVPSWIQSNPTYYTVYDLTNGSCVSSNTLTAASSTTVTLTSNVGCTVNSTDSIQFALNSNAPNGAATGWSHSYQYHSNPICADASVAGLYYAHNTIVDGVIKIYNGGANTVQGYATPTNYGSWGRIQCVPGVSGDMYISYGFPFNQAFIPYPSNFIECVDSTPSGTSAGTVSCSNVANIEDVWAFGFGPIAPGKSYPSFFCYCAVNNLGAGYLNGYWESDDHMVTWKQIPNPPTEDIVVTVVPDANTYGRFYACYGGSSCLRYN
jgi:hypothetical protein